VDPLPLPLPLPEVVGVVMLPVEGSIAVIEPVNNDKYRCTLLVIQLTKNCHVACVTSNLLNC
jgi:hypothetical protein